MKKRLKAAEDLSIGDVIKITGYCWEIDDVTVNNVEKLVTVELWCWASPRKRTVLIFNDRKFPVTVR